MAKILELESGTDPVEIPADAEQKKKTDVEVMIENVMKKAYVLGLQNGARTMCVQILSQMSETKNLNPQKQLMLLRQMCLKNMNAQKPTEQVSQDKEITKNNEKENKDNV